MSLDQLDSEYIEVRKVKSRILETIMKICQLGYLAEVLMLFENYKYLFFETYTCVLANPYSILIMPFLLLGFVCFYFMWDDYSSDLSLKRKLIIATPFIQLGIYFFMSFVLEV